MLAFAVCTLANLAIDGICAYLIPLDVAGTPPPDPRNARLRFLVTAAFQAPVTLLLAYVIARSARNTRA